MRRCVYVAVLAALMSAGQVFAESNYSFTETPVTLPVNDAYQNVSQQIFADKGTLRGSVVTVPAGQNFKAVVTSPISSATMYRGQNVSVILGTDFYYNGLKIAPAGSTVSGMVLDAAKAKHGSMNGKLSIRFTSIITPTGMQIPISAIIKTNDNTGVLVGGTALDVTKDYGKDMVVGAGTGAVTGVVMSAIGGGNIGKTAALGTAIGAGGGLVKSIWDKGNDVEIPTNANIDLYLTQPITIVPATH
ncbi:MAG: hypothetical protein NC390_04170 [Fusobacterium sp.]|nr:hypothetical protein [Fusobacterium sp.]